MIQMISRNCRVRRKRIFAIWKALDGESGASLVELAVAMTFLFPPMLIGTVDIASLAYDSIENSSAARAGAAYAAQYYISTQIPGPPTLPTVAQVTSAATTDSPELQNVLKSGTTFNVTIYTGCGTAAPTYTYTSTSSGTISYPSSANGNACATGVLPYVEVATSSTVVPLLHFSALGGSLSLNNTATINLVN
jgi:hypothetical protein